LSDPPSGEKPCRVTRDPTATAVAVLLITLLDTLRRRGVVEMDDFTAFIGDLNRSASAMN